MAMNDQRVDACPNCGKSTILRQKGDNFDHSENCEACGVLIKVPANYDKAVSMCTVQVGDGPKEPSFLRLPCIKDADRVLQYQA